MHTVRVQDAPLYDAPGHAGMVMRRLQGREAGPGDKLWIGLSVIEPQGGTTHAASDLEKFYVVLTGELRVDTVLDGRNTTERLGPNDSCRIGPGESRKLTNEGAQPCSVLLVMPLVAA